MKTLVIGDIHGNLEALQMVLHHAEAQGGFEKVWCLGDTVGYGPDPGPCLDVLRSYDPVNVAGNHDHGAVGLVGLEVFNAHAAFACRWTAQNLTDEQQAYLRDLPLVQREGSFTMVHGSLRDPVWEYLLDQEAAHATFDLLGTLRCIVSHSHIPFLCKEGDDLPVFRSFALGRPVELTEERVIVNPGSVGQPRDGDPRASYLLYNGETHSITHHRVEYEIPVTQEKMSKVGLPAPLITRLSFGR